MSDVLSPKAIIPGQDASQASDGTANDQSTETPSSLPGELSRRVMDELDDALPEKFRGKSAYDVYQSYEHSEKEKGRIASELGQARKEAEEAKSRATLAEKQLQEAAALRTQNIQPTQPQQQEVDPLSEFDKQFAEQPKEAIRSGIKSALDEARKSQALTQYQMQQQAAQQRYETLKKDKSDFTELEPEMVALAQRFGQYIKPELVNRPEMVDLMYELARGRNVEKLVSKAVEKAKASGELVREEKRAAFSESSNSQGDSETPFADLSIEEMEKRLGRSNK